MKRIYIFSFCLCVAVAASAQDFDKDIAAARSSYASGDLSNARFAMEQMLADLDRAIGKQILDMLPTTVGALPAIVKEDNVTGGSGAVTGLFVHRHYRKDAKEASVEIINNSPLINSINTFLTTPILGGMMRNENQKMVKIQGYKSILEKSDGGDGKTDYQLQIPFNNTLLTFKVDDSNESEITSMASTLPLAKIAQAAQ